jgi:hypothetical protein
MHWQHFGDMRFDWAKTEDHVRRHYDEHKRAKELSNE